MDINVIRDAILCANNINVNTDEYFTINMFHCLTTKSKYMLDYLALDYKKVKELFGDPEIPPDPVQSIYMSAPPKRSQNMNNIHLS